MSDSETVFMFSYFKGHGDGLHLALSRDGYAWTALNEDRPYITGQVGSERLMRDPFVFLGHDGLFHLVWTADWRGKSIGYTFSHDLKSWSPQQLLPVMAHEPDAQNCWAPEIFFDDKTGEYLIYWATSIPGRFPASDRNGDEGLNHRMYCVTTKDFKTFSGTRLFYDGGFNVIDATVVRDVDRYLLFLKDETRTPCEKNIRVAVGHSLFGGFGQASAPLTGDYWAEGPTAVKIDGSWIVYFDKYKLNSIGAVRSRDLVQWEDISDVVRFPSGAQHGSVAQIPFQRVRHLL